jgi:hypothetical protein
MFCVSEMEASQHAHTWATRRPCRTREHCVVLTVLSPRDVVFRTYYILVLSSLQQRCIKTEIGGEVEGTHKHAAGQYEHAHCVDLLAVLL